MKNVFLLLDLSLSLLGRTASATEAKCKQALYW